jgi:hypothetical protein
MKKTRRCGMINDVIPDLPKILESELHKENDIQEVLNQLSISSNRFIFYEAPNGQIEILFDKLGPELYACLVAKLSNPLNSKVYEFLKLVLEGIYQSKKITYRGHKIASKIESLL